jgi:hypothetical protein
MEIEGKKVWLCINRKSSNGIHVGYFSSVVDEIKMYVAAFIKAQRLKFTTGLSVRDALAKTSIVSFPNASWWFNNRKSPSPSTSRRKDWQL